MCRNVASVNAGVRKYFWQINNTDRRIQLSTDENLRLNIISIL